MSLEFPHVQTLNSSPATILVPFLTLSIERLKNDFTRIERMLVNFQTYISENRPEMKGLGSFITTMPLCTHEFLAHKFIKSLLYSPDLTSCDFWLFPELKKASQERWLSSIDEIKATVGSSYVTFSPEDCSKTILVKQEECWHSWIKARRKHFVKKEKAYSSKLKIY